MCQHLRLFSTWAVFIAFSAGLFLQPYLCYIANGGKLDEIVNNELSRLAATSDKTKSNLLFYFAGHPTYSERVVIDGEQWCVIVCVLCRPGSFGSYPSTIVRNDPVDGEPVDSEWRINVDGDNLIWRMEQGSNFQPVIGLTSQITLNSVVKTHANQFRFTQFKRFFV